jgi:hypothetical protein
MRKIKGKGLARVGTEPHQKMALLSAVWSNILRDELLREYQVVETDFVP